MGTGQGHTQSKPWGQAIRLVYYITHMEVNTCTQHWHFVEPLGGRNTIHTNHLKMSVLKNYELRRALKKGRDMSII